MENCIMFGSSNGRSFLQLMAVTCLLSQPLKMSTRSSTNNASKPLYPKHFY